MLHLQGKLKELFDLFDLDGNGDVGKVTLVSTT